MKAEEEPDVQMMQRVQQMRGGDEVYVFKE